MGVCYIDDVMKQKTIVRLTPEAAARLADWERQLDRSRTWIVSTMILNPTGSMRVFAKRVAERRQAVEKQIERLKASLGGGQ